MSAEYLVFFIFAIASIAGGIMMISAKKVMHMMVALILTFLSVAVLFIQLSAEFVGVVQIMVYAGAISIISIFGIMLTNHNDKEEKKAPLFRRIVIAITLAAFALIITAGIIGLDIPAQATSLHDNNIEQIGIALFTEYLVPFEVVSILLLVAFVGAIVLARDKPLETNLTDGDLVNEDSKEQVDEGKTEHLVECTTATEGSADEVKVEDREDERNV